MTGKKIIERHFSDTSQVWRDRIYKAKETQHWWEYFDKQYRFDYVVSMIASLPYPARILAIGCGAGQLIPVLAEMGYVVDVNDISQNMVNLAKALCKKTGVKANIKLGDCENLDYGDNSFDVVVAMGVIEYMDEDSPILGADKCSPHYFSQSQSLANQNFSHKQTLRPCARWNNYIHPGNILENHIWSYDKTDVKYAVPNGSKFSFSKR